jgi:hypothetical protein
VTPLLLGGGDGRSRFGAQGRRWVQRARPAKRSWAAWAARAAWTTGRAAANTGAAHHRLAGTNGAAIDWLAWDRRGTASRHPGPRSLLLLYLSWRRTGLLLLQARHHIGTRRHHGARGRLSSEIRARLRAQRRSWSWAGQRSGRFGWRRRGAGHRMRGQSYRRWRQGRRRSCRWHRLPRTRQDLARTRRGHGASRNWTSANWRMQRSSASRGQWRSQGRRFAAKRFFNCTNGGLLRGRCSGRLHFGNGGFCNWRVMLNRGGLMPRGLFILLDGLRLSNGDGGIGSRRMAAPAPPCTLCRIISATGSSTELEWVFFSLTPSSGNMSIMACEGTSSCLASSLIRILLINNGNTGSRCA